MKYLLTGGAGYIGAHTAIEFLNAGHQVIVADNFANSSPKALERVQLLTGKSVDIYEVDLLDKAQFRKIFEAQPIDGVVHFAGLKAVGESVEKPVDYYHTNIVSSLNLLQAMLDFNVRQLVFSSSATVYGEPEKMPIDESTAVNDATNPYGRTKLMIERIIEDVCKANPGFNAARLRYFNPAGAHESGEIGEDPKGIPNNLLPYVTQVAVGKRPLLTINGNDYPTPDGTCIRDYIHVVDLAKGHLAAVRKLDQNPGLVTYNLGTGKGYSVMDIVTSFQHVTNIEIPHVFGPRRAGDIPASYTDPMLAEQELGWKAEKNLQDILRDAWRWQQKNPDGFN